MNPNSFTWRFLKKLPIILTVLVTPATMAWVIYVNPSILDFKQSGAEEESDGRSGKAAPVVRRTPDTGHVPVRPGGVPDSDRADGAPENDAVPFVPTPPRPPPDWAAEVAACKESMDFVTLARRAELHGATELAREFYLEALSLDPDNQEAHSGLGSILFSPEKDLDAFDRFEGHQLEGELAVYREKKGRWLSPPDMAALRKEWDTTRARLEKELERRRNDPHEDQRRRHVRRLMRHDFFARLINSGEFATDRSFLPCLFFVQEGDGIDLEETSRIKEAVAADLRHVAETFESLYGGKPGALLNNQVFFVWLVQSSKGLGVSHERADRMLLVRFREGKEALPLDETFRRRIVLAFAQMIVHQLREEVEGPETEMWLSAGIPILLSWGKGMDDRGRLRLNGAGSEGNDLFTRWLAMNDGAWPVPLERLVAYDSMEEFREACSSTIPYENPRIESFKDMEIFYGGGAACALFCRYLAEEVDRDAFHEHAARWLGGEKNNGGARGLLAPRTFAATERAVSEAFISIDAGVVYREAPDRHPGSVRETGSGTAAAASNPLDSKQSPFLAPDEIDGLVRPGMPAGLLRSLIIRLVEKGSCFEAFRSLSGLLESGGAAATGSGIEKDLALLEQAALFETEMCSRLAAAGIAIRLDRKEVKIIGSGEGTLTCSAPGVEEKISVPWSSLGLARFLGLCKNELGAKSEVDRLGYALLNLLRASRGGLKKELGYVTTLADEKARLAEASKRYTQAVAGVTLIAILAGEREDEDHGDLKTLVRKLDGTGIVEPLKPFIERVLRDRILKGLLDPQSGYLAATYAGFRGTDSATGLSSFEYRFADPKELDDFILLPSDTSNDSAAFSDSVAYSDFPGSGTPLSGSKAPSVADGAMIGSGTGGAMLRPRFAGTIELFIKFRLRWSKMDPDAPWGILAGLGLGSEGGIVAAEDLQTLSIRRTPTGLPLAESSLDSPPSLKWDKPYTLFLKGTNRKAVFRFNGEKTVTLPARGTWDGFVFFWANSPLVYQIERFEVRATIDPKWLEEQLEPILQKELKAALPEE